VPPEVCYFGWFCHKDSPPSSLLGLGVEDYLGDIEVSSSPKKSEATLAKDVKNQLLDILGHI
jgi:hypothetical protein